MGFYTDLSAHLHLCWGIGSVKINFLSQSDVEPFKMHTPGNIIAFADGLVIYPNS